MLWKEQPHPPPRFPSAAWLIGNLEQMVFTRPRSQNEQHLPRRVILTLWKSTISLKRIHDDRGYISSKNFAPGQVGWWEKDQRVWRMDRLSCARSTAFTNFSPQSFVFTGPPHPPFLSSKSPLQKIWHKCHQMLSEIYDHPMLIIMEGSNNQHYPRWDLSSHLYWRKFQTHYLQNLRFIKFPRR